MPLVFYSHLTLFLFLLHSHPCYLFIFMFSSISSSIYIVSYLVFDYYFARRISERKKNTKCRECGSGKLGKGRTSNAGNPYLEVREKKNRECYLSHDLGSPQHPQGPGAGMHPGGPGAVCAMPYPPGNSPPLRHQFWVSLCPRRCVHLGGGVGVRLVGEHVRPAVQPFNGIGMRVFVKKRLRRCGR